MLTVTDNNMEKFLNLVKTIVEKVKFKKNRRKVSNVTPWLNSDYKKAKEELRILGKNNQRTHKDPSLRKILTQKEKEISNVNMG